LKKLKHELELNKNQSKVEGIKKPLRKLQNILQHIQQ